MTDKEKADHYRAKAKQLGYELFQAQTEIDRLRRKAKAHKRNIREMQVALRWEKAATKLLTYALDEARKEKVA